MDDVPGYVTFWLRRASLDDLIRVRNDEAAKGMTARWAFVVAIDKELHARDEALRKALTA